jgi:hypothetical protein
MKTATPTPGPSRLRRLATALTSPARHSFAWWNGLAPQERVLYRALLLVTTGWGIVWAPLALIVPGSVLLLVFFGFTFRRST